MKIKWYPEYILIKAGKHNFYISRRGLDISIMGLGLTIVFACAVVTRFQIKNLNGELTELREEKLVMEEQIEEAQKRLVVLEAPRVPLEENEISRELTPKEQFDQELLSLPEDKKEWFLGYKELVEKYSGEVEMPQTIYEAYSEDEIYLMARMVETECYGCPFEAKTHVASVLFNRLAEGSGFSNDVYQVIKPGQFCYHRKTISEDTWLALEYAYEIEDTTQGALYFNNFGNSHPDTWNGKPHIFTDEVNHSFY